MRDTDTPEEHELLTSKTFTGIENARSAKIGNGLFGKSGSNIFKEFVAISSHNTKFATCDDGTSKVSRKALQSDGCTYRERLIGSWKHVLLDKTFSNISRLLSR